jgi:hypothetical protein
MVLGHMLRVLGINFSAPGASRFDRNDQLVAMEAPLV